MCYKFYYKRELFCWKIYKKKELKQIEKIKLKFNFEIIDIMPLLEEQAEAQMNNKTMFFFINNYTDSPVKNIQLKIF
mgnify:CR=1 FL=1